jgi:hypothetical protein
MRLAGFKLPIATKFVSRLETGVADASEDQAEDAADE